jgi:hypothetical protein
VGTWFGSVSEVMNDVSSNSGQKLDLTALVALNSDISNITSVRLHDMVRKVKQKEYL